MCPKPDPKKTDSLGRKRLSPEKYSQSGGWRQPRHIVWTCKVCSRAWNVASKSSRYDAKCRQCGTRNTILLTRPGSFYPGRKRITQFLMFSTPGDALFYAQSRNEQWMRRRTKKGFGTNTFVKASELNKKRSSADDNSE
jgi:hypothetical protein